MKFISIAEIEYLFLNLAKETMDFNEPIPAFSARPPNILESCLGAPLQGFSEKSLYHGLIAKAAILFYLMVKNYPFQGGNRRIAMATLLVLLHKNKKWLKADNQELYNFAVWIAASPARLKNETVKAVEKFIKTYLADL